MNYDLLEGFLPAPEEWMDQALCAALGYHVWDGLDTDAQLQACYQCPVMQECRDYAARVEPGPYHCYGVLGGLSVRARRKTLTGRPVMSPEERA